MTTKPHSLQISYDQGLSYHEKFVGPLHTCEQKVKELELNSQPLLWIILTETGILARFSRLHIVTLQSLFSESNDNASI